MSKQIKHQLLYNGSNFTLFKHHVMYDGIQRDSFWYVVTEDGFEIPIDISKFIVVKNGKKEVEPFMLKGVTRTDVGCYTINFDIVNDLSISEPKTSNIEDKDVNEPLFELDDPLHRNIWKHYFDDMSNKKKIKINFSDFNNIKHSLTVKPTKEEVFQIIELLLTIETID